MLTSRCSWNVGASTWEVELSCGAKTHAEQHFPEHPAPPARRSRKRTDEPTFGWAKLLAIAIACTICSGLVPGMAVFVDLLVQAKVFGSLCMKNTDRLVVPQSANSSTQFDASPCDDQFLAISSVFNAANGVTLFALLPIGLFFDRYGAHDVCVVGAALVFVGLGLLQVPLLGAQMGYDSLTCYILPFAVMVTDVGSMLNSQCMIGLVWHFPGSQAFVISLSNATYQAASVLPVMLTYVMGSFDLSLASAVLVYMGMVSIAAVVCHRLTPNQAEFYSRAEEVLGLPLPPPPKNIDCCAMLQKGNASLRQHMRDHLWTIMMGSVGFTYSSLYQTLAGDYGAKMFGSPAEGKKLAQLFATLNAVVGGTLAPLGINLLDQCGLNIFIMVLLACHCGAWASIAIPTWQAQTVASLCMVTFLAVFLTFTMKYFLAYASPNRIGVVQGLMFAYAMLWNLPIMLSFQLWMEVLPDGQMRIALPLFVAAGLASGCFGAYAFRFSIVGTPIVPALLPSDELELAKPFGCKNLEEVCYITHTESRQQLLAALSSMEPGSLAILVARVDADRVAEILTGRDADELAEMMQDIDVEGNEKEENEDEFDELEEPGEENGTGVKAPLLPHASCKNRESIDQGRSCMPADAMQHNCGHSSFTAQDGIGVVLVPDTLDAQSLKLCTSQSQTRRRSEAFVAAIKAHDASAIEAMFMTTSAEDIWESYVDMDSWLSELEKEDIEKQFDSLIPGRQLANMLRRRKELKPLIAKMAKRQLQQRLAKVKRRRRK